MMSSGSDSESYSSASDTLDTVRTNCRTEAIPPKPLDTTVRHRSGPQVYRSVSLNNPSPWRKSAFKRLAPQPPVVRRPDRASSFLQGFKDADAKTDNFPPESSSITGALSPTENAPNSTDVELPSSILHGKVNPGCDGNVKFFLEPDPCTSEAPTARLLANCSAMLSSVSPTVSLPPRVESKAIPSIVPNRGAAADTETNENVIPDSLFTTDQFTDAQAWAEDGPSIRTTKPRAESNPLPGILPNRSAIAYDETNENVIPDSLFTTDQFTDAQEWAEDGPFIRTAKPRYKLHHSVSDTDVPRRKRESIQRQMAPVVEETATAGDRSSWIVEKWRQNEAPPAQSAVRPRADSVVTVAHICEELIVSSKYRIKVTLTNFSVMVIMAAFIMPNFAAILFSVFRLVFGVLFPAYYSYKAVRTKDIKAYVTWMMYWIVFALFTCAETFTDIFLSFWFPFYYEIKILVVLWLLSPATRGSSFLYRQFVHPWLITREDEIDDCIEKAKQQGYTTVVQLGTKGVQYASNIIMQTALKGGGGIVNTLKRSYSTNDVGQEWGAEQDVNRNVASVKERQAEVVEEDDDSDYTPPDSRRTAKRRQDTVDYAPRGRSDSDGSRLRDNPTARARRVHKAKSVDISELLDDIPDGVPQRRSPRIKEATKEFQLIPYLEPLQEEPQQRKSKYRKPTRAHSFTMPKTLQESLLDPRARELLFSSDFGLSRSPTLTRRLTRSFRVRPTYVR